MSESKAKFVKKTAFVMYPINKSTSGYSYKNGNATINIQFSRNATRVLSSSSLRLCGRMNIVGKNASQMPANHFDMPGAIQASVDTYEQVCYIDDRTGVSCLLNYVQCGDLFGSSYEIIDDYARGQSSINSATNGYYDMCSAANMNLSAYANNDVISREVSSPIEFAIPVQLGYIQSNPIIPLNRGFFIKANLCADAMALYGLNADKFTVSIDNVYLMGDYFDLDKPLADLDMTYTSRKHRNGTLNSNNEFLNVDLNLAQVQSIYHNFSPKTWKESYSYNSFSTCPLLEKDAAPKGFKVARIKQYNTNRGAVRFPNLYPVDETDINQEPNGFQTLRSRLYLDSIFPYVYNRRCLISPVSEGLAQMVAPPDSDLRTPQSVDFGFNQQWQKDATTGKWSRTGKYESASHVFGIGTTYDALFARQSANFQSASYNYSIESELNNTPQSIFVYCNAGTSLEKSTTGQMIAIS
jgi:hypothetical protein